MSVQPPPAPPAAPPGSTSDGFTLENNDRILAALGYVIWLVALVVVLLDETKRKPLLKDHAVQALGFAVAGVVYGFFATFIFICGAIISFGILAFVLWVLFFVPLVVGAYFGYLAYTQDGLTEIPWLTKFMTDQGWFETRKAV
jgi:hypothetical protein